MKKLISAPFLFLIFISVLSSCSSSLEKNDDDNSSDKSYFYPNDLMYFSQDFYLAVRYEDPLEAYVDTLSKLDPELLSNDLNSYNKSLAFWINVYNSLVQVKILSDENSFKDQDQFFNSKDLVVAGTNVSLNDLEHGILRLKESDNTLVKKFKLDSLDYRIHFTMNCGAASCPAIAYYKPETIQEDLTVAENLFIVQSSVYDTLSNTLEISELLKWFAEDFGGNLGIYKVMIKNNIIDENVNPKIIYKPYDWELKSRNYQ